MAAALASFQHPVRNLAETIATEVAQLGDDTERAVRRWGPDAVTSQA